VTFGAGASWGAGASRGARAAWAVCIGMAAAGCADTLGVGEFGDFRYIGNVRGETPALPLLPPYSDRDGNAYVLYGDINLLERELYIGTVGGGWRSGCQLTEGNDFGVHGFIGRTQDRVWYWTGDALLQAAPFLGGGICQRVLEFDPSSGALLLFKAVAPWVRDTPSRTTTVAWVQAFTDPLPFQVVLDLDRNIYTDVEEFEPSNAEDVTVLGTGGILEKDEAVFVVRYRVGDTVRTEARFVDHDGVELETVSLNELNDLPPYGIVGFVQGSSSGLYAALDVEGQVTTFDKSGGKRRSVSGMNPVGIHEWDGELFIVGATADGRPRFAAIEDGGGFGDTETWDASIAAADNLGNEIEVIDDRSLPSRDATWKDPRTAIGFHFFVSPHKLDFYATDTTTWLVAGPSFGQQQGNPQTAVAWVPVGISYFD
jgi:hypothetical protein